MRGSDIGKKDRYQLECHAGEVGLFFFFFGRIGGRSLQGAGSVKITLEGHKTGDRPMQSLLE